MKKKIFTLMTAALFAAGASAQDKTVTYAIQDGETHKAGETVEVKDGDEVVATLTFGFEGGADFTAPKKDDKRITGFWGYTEGNGENGKEESGTVYIIKPNHDGEIEVGVVLNATKPFFILENEVALAGYNGTTVDDKYYGTYKFNVKADKEYKVYCTGSKLGFYGFNYTYDPSSASTPETTTIKLNAAGYATYSCSYDVEVSGAKAYTATLSGNVITCTEITSGQIPAGEGVLLFGDGEAEVTLTPIEAAAELGENDLKATTDADNKLADMPETCYVLSGKTFKKYTGSAFTPNKAYLDGSDVAGARSLSITFGDDDTTGIKVITNAQNNQTEYFDLQGRRVAQPTKGLYIIDGKKVIIK